MDPCHFGLFLILLFGFGANFIEATDLYSLSVNDLQGNSVPMSVFKGKVSVNDNEGMTSFTLTYFLGVYLFPTFFLLFLNNHVIL